MNRIFEHFHLNLVMKDQPDLLGKSLSREEWIRSIFSDRFEFRHRNKVLHWVPHGDQSDMILGTIERHKVRTQHRGPDEGAAEFDGEEWQGSIIIIDPVHRKDGQKLAFERDKDVGEPNAMNGDLYSSTSRRLTVKMQSILNLAKDSKESISQWLGQALGREQGNSVGDTDRADSDADLS